MAELSTNNSSESNHKLVNMKLIDRDHLEQSQYKRILIVDDNSDIAFTLCVELESDPVMKVYSYDSPVTALLDFKPNFYDLLLIDVNMPLMDGFQLAQKLLQISHNDTVFTIQVTLVEESTQVPPPSTQPVDTLKIVRYP